MRRISTLTLIALALAAAVSPAGASDSGTDEVAPKKSIVERPPMDVGADQVNTLAQIREDLLYAPKSNAWWFDAGVSYPTGTLQDNNVDPGLLLRVNHQIWRGDAFGVVGSVGAYFGKDSYFNDAQEEIAFNAPITINGYSGVDIQSRYYNAFPAMLMMQFAPFGDAAIHPVLALGPGVVWAHSDVVTSAVNNGVGTTVNLGDLDPLTTGPGGEQGISPYGIRTRTTFSPAWEARVGLGFRMSNGPQPLYMRILATGTTYYNHTAPRTLLGFAASFSR